MNRATLAIGAAVLIGLGAAAGYWVAGYSPATRRVSNPVAEGAAAAPAASKDREVLYWHDPMHPQQKFDKPGKSPYMDMQLVPVYAGDESQAAGVKVNPQLAQNLGVRTAVAERGRLATTVEVVGSIAFDERAVHLVQARTAGYIEQLFVRAPLDPVRRGQPLARLFVPEWAGAQQEYLALKSSGVEGAADLARAARNRLLLMNMSEEQIQAVDREGKPVARVTLVSPADGVIGELGAREGMSVMPGVTLFRINGLSTVWVNLDVPEPNAAAIRPGAPIVATVPAYPGEKFSGRVSAVLPEVVAATRTVRARVELANPGGRLKPGMFATVSVTPPQSADAVLVPTEAVIVTGKRSLVVVDRGQGRYEPVEVQIGREEGGRTEIAKGIEAGTRVVASGQFLIDSEASLRGVERRMTPESAQSHHAEGKLENISGNAVTISHGPIPSLKWGAMTMEFNAPKGGVPQGLKAGDAVVFEFVQSPQGSFDITKIDRKGAGGAS